MAIVTVEEQQTENLDEDYVTNEDEINLSEHESLAAPATSKAIRWLSKH